jgi:hypothetical protein
LRFYEEGSDIWFGDFDDADCYRIEQTSLYQRRMKPHGISSAEFLLLRSTTAQDRGKLLMVEAKKTLASVNSNEFHGNLTHIAKQFMDSLELALGIWLGNHEGKAELPLNYNNFF